MSSPVTDDIDKRNLIMNTYRNGEDDEFIDKWQQVRGVRKAGEHGRQQEQVGEEGPRHWSARADGQQTHAVVAIELASSDLSRQLADEEVGSRFAYMHSSAVRLTFWATPWTALIPLS